MNTTQLENNILKILFDYPHKFTDVEEIVRPQCFTGLRKNIYEAMLSLNEQQIEIDILTVLNEMKRSEIQVQVLDLTILQEGHSSLDKLDTYCKMLFEKYLLKEIEMMAKSIIVKIKTEPDPF